MKLKIQALGIVMILFGSPIIYFFRDFLRLAPNSAAFTAFFSGVFLIMIFSFSHLKRIYKPDFNMSVTAIAFLVFSIFHALVSTNPFKVPIEFFNYIFIFIYFYLICGVKKEVANVIIPILIVVTLLDNAALIIAFLRNPLLQLGQRAIISNKGWGEGGGNPSLYSFMAFTGIVVSLTYLNNKSIFWKLTCVANIATSIVVILLSLVRATILVMVISAFVYLFFNWKNIFKSTPNKRFVDYGLSKSNFYILCSLFIFFIGSLFILDEKLVENLFKYITQTYETVSRVIETVTSGTKAKAVDASAAGRLNTFNFAIDHLAEEPLKIIYGFGYRFEYIDIPIVQVLLEEGVIGLAIILLFHYYVSKNVAFGIQFSENKWITVLCYYYILLLMNSISRGQPYEPYFWNYFVTLARFIKKEDMFFNKDGILA